MLKGFDALGYTEHEDYQMVQSTNPEFNKVVIRINVYHEHRQTVQVRSGMVVCCHGGVLSRQPNMFFPAVLPQYIHPGDSHKLEQAELVCVDEAAAIPLPLVKKLLGPYLVFLASTVNGYEGTGRSLSLKLLEQLRQQSSLTGIPSTSQTATSTGHPSSCCTLTLCPLPPSLPLFLPSPVFLSHSACVCVCLLLGRVLREVSLSEPIRYADGDPVEQWLHDLLCLDAANVQRIISGCPLPRDCELYPFLPLLFSAIASLLVLGKEKARVSSL